ncbi:MAG: zinc-binding metallopeptidase family protein [Mycobacterium sp.]
MRAFACPVCHVFTPFEADRCPSCGASVGLHLPTQSMVAVVDDEATLDGQLWLRCTQADPLGCNWLVPAEQDAAARGRCLPDSLIRRRPDPDDTIALEKLAPTAMALRRLVYQLLDLGLPVDPYWRRDGGLAFDLLSSFSTGEKVMIGHANGVITIDLVESLDAYRESLRVRLGEPYRTMLGHFRHEAGHYYQSILVENGPGAERHLDRCRQLFGDELADYPAAIQRHYKFGAPGDWPTSFISEYATMHPWEDFAECFAHYLHITDTLDTTSEAGMVLRADMVQFGAPHDVTPLKSYADVPITRLLSDWSWVSLFLNRVNAAMGKNPLYPFEISAPVAEKLGFVHAVLRDPQPIPPPTSKPSTQVIPAAP